MPVVGIELARFGMATLETNHYTTTAGSTEMPLHYGHYDSRLNSKQDKNVFNDYRLPVI